jgi:hypothetical protein
MRVGIRGRAVWRNVANLLEFIGNFPAGFFERESVNQRYPSHEFPYQKI